MTNDEAEAMRKLLSEHYRCPVMPISRYCAALRLWEEARSVSARLRKALASATTVLVKCAAYAERTGQTVVGERLMAGAVAALESLSTAKEVAAWEPLDSRPSIEAAETIPDCINIESVRGRCGGDPVVCGTRLTTCSPYAFAAEGFDLDHIQAQYPDTSIDDLRVAVAFEAGRRFEAARRKESGA